MEKQKQILILGLGNILLQDEGIGVHALNEMNKLKWPENVKLLDGGTGGFVLLSLFQQYQHIIIIDAALNNEKPGSIKLLKPKFASDFPRSLSTHELGLKDLIESSYLLGFEPNLFLIVVSISSKQEMKIELTETISATIHEIIEIVKKLVLTINIDAEKTN